MPNAPEKHSRIKMPTNKFHILPPGKRKPNCSKQRALVMPKTQTINTDV